MIINTDTGKHHIWLQDIPIGPHHLLILAGGEQPHIGATVICEPHQPAQTITLGDHLDHLVLKPLAEKTAAHLNTTIVAVGGIHITNASKEDINRIITNCNKLTAQLLKSY